MIPTLLRTGWLNLRRDPVALLLTFVVPIAMFSVFAAVFGSMDDTARRPVKVALWVEERTPAADELASRLAEVSGLRILEVQGETGARDAEERVRMGQAAVAVVVPAGYGRGAAEADTLGRPDDRDVKLLADTSNPIALEVVQGAVRGAMLPRAEPTPAPEVAPPTATSATGIEIVDVLGEPGKKPSIAFFAAGIGVMFLLFAVSGRSGILIEERESGVLVRMLTSRLGVSRLLAGRWLFLLLLGATQVTAMFVWGALVFGLDLFTPRHLLGFSLMTLATAAAAAAFALLLAVVCKTRAQLNGVAIVLVLIMSAVGGSMFPRFLMPDALQEVGRFTFNAWALDGYRKVFWYEAEARALLPELLVLTAVTVVLLAASRWLAGRWQRA